MQLWWVFESAQLFSSALGVVRDEEADSIRSLYSSYSNKYLSKLDKSLIDRLGLFQMKISFIQTG